MLWGLNGIVRAFLHACPFEALCKFCCSYLLRSTSCCISFPRKLGRYPSNSDWPLCLLDTVSTDDRGHIPFIISKEGWGQVGGKRKNHEVHLGSFTSFSVAPDSTSLATRLSPWNLVGPMFRGSASSSMDVPLGHLWPQSLPFGMQPGLHSLESVDARRLSTLLGFDSASFAGTPPPTCIHQGHCPQFVGGWMRKFTGGWSELHALNEIYQP